MTEFDYSSTNRRWQRLRQRALRRDGHRCQESARYGRSVPAEVVHHIWPVEEYPEYAYCLWNLVSLSRKAHDAMHHRVTKKLTPAGLRWKNRTPPTPFGGKIGTLTAGRGTPRTRSGKFSGAKIREGPQVKRARAYAQDADAYHAGSTRRCRP